MLCYRDASFCDYYKECKDGKKCTRALTPKVKKNALKWWHSFMDDDKVPIAVFAEKPECFKMLEEK